MNETQLIIDAVRKIVRAIRLSSAASERVLGLSSAQLFVLQKLADGEPASLGELARRTLTDPSSVSVVVRKLVKAGFITKGTSASDRRSVQISLAPKGARILARGSEPFQRRLLTAISKLPAVERQALAQSLVKIVRHADLITEPASMFFEE